MKIKNIIAYSLPLLALTLSACQKNASPKPSSSKVHQVQSITHENNENSEKDKLAKEKYIFQGKLSNQDKSYLKNLSVSAFGDSIMEGCRQDYEEVFPKINVDAGVSRQASSLIGSLNNSLPNTVIIGLGTNGPFSKAQYDQIMHSLGKRQVYWINTNVNKEWHDEVNSLLNMGSQRYSNAHVINWEKYSQGHDDWFWDGIHPNIEGRKIMVDFVARNIIADQYN